MKIKAFGRTLEIKASTSTMPALSDDSAWKNYLSGKGYAVSSNTALKVATVIRCVDVMAKTLASLPLHLYKEAPTGKEKAKDHSIYKLIHVLPNPLTTAYEFWHMYIFNLMLTRGAYAKIVRDRNGFIKELWNIPTANVSKWFNNTSGERYIKVALSGNQIETLYEGQFMYTPGLRFNSDCDPESSIAIAAEVLGLTMALNGYAKDFFENGTNLGGCVEIPNALSEAAYTRFKESWQEAYAGIINQHKVAFLEEGAKFKEFGRDPESAQALESRKFQVLEICRIYGIPPHKVFELDRATFSNIEQQNIEFVQESLSPMSVRLEQTMYKDLLNSIEQIIYYAKFGLNGLLRGDLATRADYYHNARQDGWMSANDIRELEDMNKIPAEDGGDVYAVNGNMIPLTAIPMNLPKGAQNAKT